MLDHISLSDPITWVGVLVASFLIAGLRFLLRSRSAPEQDGDKPEG